MNREFAIMFFVVLSIGGLILTLASPAAVVIGTWTTLAGLLGLGTSLLC